MNMITQHDNTQNRTYTKSFDLAKSVLICVREIRLSWLTYQSPTLRLTPDLV